MEGKEGRKKDSGNKRQLIIHVHQSLLSSTIYDGIQSHKLPGLHRQRACPKAVHFMSP